jgi:hypothetical protein
MASVSRRSTQSALVSGTTVSGAVVREDGRFAAIIYRL